MPCASGVRTSPCFAYGAPEATENKAQATEPAAAAAAVAATAAAEQDDGLKKFIPTLPIREDQVENAVNFLSHPKVKGSPIFSRRSFLERKGLSKEEIDEAFRRVPDPMVPQATGHASAAQVVPQQAQPATQPAIQQAQPAMPPVSSAVASIPRKGARWSQILLALGVLSAAGAGATLVSKKYVIPQLKAWIRRIVLEDNTVELKKPEQPTVDSEASQIATAAVEIAAIAKELMAFRMEDRTYMERMLNSLEARDRELKTTLNAMAELRHVAPVANGDASPYKDAELISSGLLPQGAEDVKLSNGVFAATGRAYNDRSARPLSAPATPAADTHTPPAPASYMELVAMVERGEKPPGIREINDKPLNASQAPSAARMEPKPKPWEINQDVTHTREPWWRRKNEDSPVIAEIEEWQPPPPPKTRAPGVDAAIRPRPKSPQSSASGRFQDFDSRPQSSQNVNISNVEVVPSSSYYSYTGAVQDVKMNPRYPEVVQDVKMSFESTTTTSGYAEPAEDTNQQPSYLEAAPEITQARQAAPQSEIEEHEIQAAQDVNSSSGRDVKVYLPEDIATPVTARTYHPEERTTPPMNGNQMVEAGSSSGGSGGSEDKSVPEA